MATLAEVEAQLNELVQWRNALIANAKTIDDLPAMSPIVNSSNTMVRDGGITKKLTIQQIITEALLDRFVIIDGKPFRIHKDNANIINLNTLEINDVIIGYSSVDTFLMAKYLGGDVTDFTNESIYEKFSGF